MKHLPPRDAPVSPALLRQGSALPLLAQSGNLSLGKAGIRWMPVKGVFYAKTPSSGAAPYEAGIWRTRNIAIEFAV